MEPALPPSSSIPPPSSHNRSKSTGSFRMNPPSSSNVESPVSDSILPSSESTPTYVEDASWFIECIKPWRVAVSMVTPSLSTRSTSAPAVKVPLWLSVISNEYSSLLMSRTYTDSITDSAWIAVLVESLYSTILSVATGTRPCMAILTFTLLSWE